MPQTKLRPTQLPPAVTGEQIDQSESQRRVLHSGTRKAGAREKMLTGQTCDAQFSQLYGQPHLIAIQIPVHLLSRAYQSNQPLILTLPVQTSPSLFPVVHFFSILVRSRVSS